jgi:hypothetical protein
MMIALLVLALAQDKVKLELKAVVGEKSSHAWKESNTSRIIASAAGGQSVANHLQTETRRFRDEVLEVEGPAPARVRRTIDEWTERKQRDGETFQEVKKLQGRTITLKRTSDEGTAVEGAEDVPPAELRKQRLRPEILFGAFPAEPVAVGQEWALEEKTLLKDFGASNDATQFTTAQGRAKLEAVEDHKGVRCAVVSLSVKASGSVKGQEALKTSFDVRARVWVDVAKGRLLTMKGEGEGKIEGSLDQDGEKIKLDGTFTLSIEAEQTYE